MAACSTRWPQVATPSVAKGGVTPPGAALRPSLPSLCPSHSSWGGPHAPVRAGDASGGFPLCKSLLTSSLPIPRSSPGSRSGTLAARLCCVMSAPQNRQPKPKPTPKQQGPSAATPSPQPAAAAAQQPPQKQGKGGGGGGGRKSVGEGRPTPPQAPPPPDAAAVRAEAAARAKEAAERAAAEAAERAAVEARRKEEEARLKRAADDSEARARAEEALRVAHARIALRQANAAPKRPGAWARADRGTAVTEHLLGWHACLSAAHPGVCVLLHPTRVQTSRS